MVGCGWPGFAELRLGRGCSGFSRKRLDFSCVPGVKLYPLPFAVYFCISIYFFDINDVINDVSTFISYPCRIFAVMFIVWPS